MIYQKFKCCWGYYSWITKYLFETIAIIFGSHVSFVPMFYHSRKIQHILFKAYLCKYHENLNFKLKLIKRLKKLMIKIPASVLLLLIKKRMKICHGREKTEREIFIPLDDNTSSGLWFDLKTFNTSCDISWFSLCPPFDLFITLNVIEFFSQEVLTSWRQKIISC